MKTLLLLSVVFLSFHCQIPSAKVDKEKNEEKLSYLALGDSYTIGTKIVLQNSYPYQLVDSLKNYDCAVNKPQIIAQNGWTTADLLEGIQSADIENETYDIVTLLIGVNNQYQGRGIEEYKKEYKELLNKAIQFAGGDKSHVFVLSIPDYGYTPFTRKNQKSISESIKIFNAACQTITKNNDVMFYNITPITREVENHPEYVAKDGLHPSKKLYARWINSIVLPLANAIK